jgi:hypothetical protein
MAWAGTTLPFTIIIIIQELFIRIVSNPEVMHIKIMYKYVCLCAETESDVEDVAANFRYPSAVRPEEDQNSTKATEILIRYNPNKINML